MRLISINCSTGRTVNWQGKEITTSIFKQPVSGSVWISRLNVEGDRQSDLKVHGGIDKAVYSYDWEDYSWWSNQLARELSYGAFGENLTTESLPCGLVCVGDVIRAGTAVLQASQPRLPCYKLGIRFEDNQMPKRFVKAGRWGIYFRVLEEGSARAGDEIEFLSRDPQRISIADLGHYATGAVMDIDWLKRAGKVESLMVRWKNDIAETLKEKENPNENRA